MTTAQTDNNDDNDAYAKRTNYSRATTKVRRGHTRLKRRVADETQTKTTRARTVATDRHRRNDTTSLQHQRE